METKVAVLLHNDSGSAEKTLRELKFSNTEAKRVMFCLAAAKEFSKFAGTPSGLEARRFLAYVKNMGPEGFDRSLHEFFTFAEAVHLNQLEQLKSLLSEKVISRKELDISGNDLMTTLNVAPGPRIKSILDSLYNEVLHHPELNEKSKLLELAGKFEKIAFTALTESRTKKAAPDWWRLSPGEEKDLLDKEYDFGNGIKFKVKDIPELASQVEVPAGPEQHHPEKNQLLHNNMVYDKAREISEDPMVWFAAALHDLGKSYTDKTKWPKQHGHEVGGVPFVERVSDLLGVSPEWKEFASIVAENHLKCHTSQQLTPKVLKRLFDLFKNDKEKFNAFLTSCEADAQGRMGGYADKPYEQKQYLSQKWDEGFPVHKNQGSTLALSGSDLMQELGLKPGQELGKILKTIKEMVDANPMLNDRETLLGIAKNLLIK
jgi:tRNA nucleotidyltransferase/poly(A) polymerase